MYVVEPNTVHTHMLGTKRTENSVQNLKGHSTATVTAEGDQKMLCSEQLEANCGTVDLCVTIFAELEGDV